VSSMVVNGDETKDNEEEEIEMHSTVAKGAKMRHQQKSRSR
jgi:hypothetical protein